MATTTSNNNQLTNTPQAGDDYYGWIEDQLLASGLLHGNVVTLNVMANDLGGNAKKLWSIDDGNGNTNVADYDLVTSDMGGCWEKAAVNNLGVADKITISNGAVLLDLSSSLGHFGATSVNGLAAGDHIHDVFVYAIRLANGALSQATVTVDIWGENDVATISGDTSGSRTEDDTTPATGTLTVVDPDAGQSHTQTASGTTAKGSWSVDGNGHWSYTVNNAAENHLAAGVHDSDSFVVTSQDGTAPATVNIDIIGVNDAASISGDTAGSRTEDHITPATGILTVTDPDDGESHTQTASGTTAKGSWSVDGNGHWSYTVNNAAENHLAAGVHDSDSFVVTSQDGTAPATVNIDIIGVNDAASISGDTAGSRTEDHITPATGILTVTDPDDGESHTQTASGTTAKGSWSVDGNGHWSYTVNNAAENHLAAGVHDSDSFVVTSQDGTAPATVNIDIIGVNDAASISGDTAGSRTEDHITPATGILTVTDPDDGESHTQTASGTTAKGSWSVDGNGHWSYTVNNAAENHLAAGVHDSDSFVVTSQDGTAPATVNIDIIGVNDAASISGDTAGSRTEDHITPATGILTVTDPDDGESHTQTASGTTAKGSWSVDGNGHWSYTVNNAAENHLAAGVHDSDSFVVTSQDGTAPATVNIDIIGVNDAASISGDTAGSRTEDHITPATGILTVTDPDDGESHTQTASGTTAKGSWSVDGNGHWSYTVNNAAENHLAAGVHDSDSFVVTSQDGTAPATVNIDIIGVNDAASISGDTAGSRTEDHITPATGILTVTDPDDGESHTQTASGTTAKGSWSVDGNGHWSYTVNNAAENHLAAGVHDSDSFVVTSQDGTAPATVNIDIIGVNDAPVIGGQDTGSVTEAGAGGPGTALASGLLTVSDPDTGQSAFNTQTNVATSYGHFTLGSGGSWNYTLDNSNTTVNALNTGQPLHDLINVSSVDGTSHTVDITINGTTDDLGPPTGIFFSINTAASGPGDVVGTFQATGDPDNGAGDFTYSASLGTHTGGAPTVDLMTGALTASPNSTGTLTVTATHLAESVTASFDYQVGANGSGSESISFTLSNGNANISSGLGGGDNITGSGDIDYLSGGNANDTLQGNVGADWLSGGAGNDHFVYATAGDSTHTAFDTILDLISGTDKIDFKNALGLTTDVGDLGAATTLGAHNVGWKFISGDAVVYANTGGGTEAIATGADVMEVHLTGLASLATTDINLHA